MWNPNEFGYDPNDVDRITKNFEQKPESPGYDTENINQIVRKWDTTNEVSDVLTSKDILDNLNEKNCCDRLLTLFQLFHEAWIIKKWIGFYKILEDWAQHELFSTEAIIVPEEMFNRWKLTADCITVNPIISSSNENYSLELSDIENTEEYAPWKQRIIRFIQEHAKYLN